MVISSDVMLKGTAWSAAINSLSTIFKIRTNYSVYLLSTAIGIMYDKQIDVPEGCDDQSSPPSVPRNVFNNNSEPFEFLFQSAILTTKCEKFNEDDRLSLAFSEKKSDFNKMAFLTKFANYGVTKLLDLVANDSLETMENIKNFLTSTMEGTNFDIDPLNDAEIDDETIRSSL
jgi:hypothetical protein